jgi:hypothetical protein
MTSSNMGDLMKSTHSQQKSGAHLWGKFSFRQSNSPRYNFQVNL